MAKTVKKTTIVDKSNKLCVLQLKFDKSASILLTSETISDSAECYAGLQVHFESSAACM